MFRSRRALCSVASASLSQVRLATITRLQSNGEEMPHHPQDPPHSRLARTRQGSLLNLFQVGVLNVILAWTTSGFAGSLEDAVAAWRQRDVAKAFELLRPLAEQGVAQAQWRLGMIYLTEQKNDAERVLRQAREPGEARRYGAA